MSTIQLVVTDLDGTLFYDRENVTKRDQFCIHRLNALGIPLVLATGRDPRLILPALDRLNLRTHTQYAIYSGGCGILNLSTNDNQPIGSMSSSLLQKIYAKYCNCGLSFLILQDGVLYTNHLTNFLRQEASLLHFKVMESPNFSSIIKRQNGKFILCGEKSRIDVVLPFLMQDHHPDYHFVRSHDNYIDCDMRGINKGTALLQLCHQLNISPHDVLGIGDNMNDFTLLKVAGFSACPGDGHPDIKSFVNYIACPSIQGAVADACEHFIFQNTK